MKKRINNMFEAMINNLRISKENDEEENKKHLIFILIIIILLISLSMIIIEVVMTRPSKPIIKNVKNIWYNNKIVTIEKDTTSKSQIKYYLYCITDEKTTNNCEWKKTKTKNILVESNGVNYVYFKAVDSKNNIGPVSNPEKVKIDNISPTIISANATPTVNTIKISVDAKDKESGIKNYYYQIDNGELIKTTDKQYTFENLKPNTIYTINIIVVDKAGNKKELTITVKTLSEEQNNINNSSNNNTVTDNTNNNTTTDNSNNDDETKPEEIQEIPELSLSKVPVSFNYGESYDLPSSYKFGPSGGEVSCQVEDKEYKNTDTIPVGTHEIVCTAKSNKGPIVTERKTVEVLLNEEKEEVWDGWIRMNLYFPENSTEWQWRLGKEGETRTGNDNSAWTDYTGPITVRLTDVENVYIKYKLKDGTEVIESPSGRLIVDIVPSKYSLEGTEKTTVKINYTSTADKKQYQINDGKWQDYTGSFEVEKNTTINARVIKSTKIYDSNGNYQSTTKQTNYDSVYISEKVIISDGESTSTPGGNIVPGTGPNKGHSILLGPDYTQTPTTSLEGPTITNLTNEIVTETSINITTKEKARKIYYRIGDRGSYKEYIDDFTVSSNTTVYAYYIRESDGQLSNTTSLRIRNIKVSSKPYVIIDTDKNLYDLTTEMNVTISGSDYDKLEYSYDNEIYYPYTNSLNIKNNCKIYAKGINSAGETIESINITNIGNNPPMIQEDNLAVSIIVTPNNNEVTGLINKATVSIDYDQDATEKYYKIGNSDYVTYSGSFEVESNTIIRAYARNSTGKGKATKQIDYLINGISEPIITPNTTSDTTSVEITINYDQNASLKQYKIGEGDWMEYTKPFTVSENTTIYAKNENILGDTNSSSYIINNIVEMPKYALIDKESYFVLRLNYPISSTLETREYKWTPSGEWKKYKTAGILLIKQEYKDEVLESAGVKITDDNGNETIFTGDYYIINMPMDELMENLFMRWDPAIPKKPEITLNPSTPTKSLEVSIKYDEVSVENKYKLVYSDGTSTDWLDYEKSIYIDKNNTIVYAKSITEAGVLSETAVKNITNVDEIKPTIDAVADFETPTRKLTIQLNGEDNLKVETVGYAEGEHDADYFDDHGNEIINNGTFTVEENGKYTIYVEDAVGNKVVKIIEITNIDKSAPDIDINVLTVQKGTTAEVKIDFGDSTKKEYKVGTNGTYKTYTDKFEIKSNDVLSLANEDKTITIYAKGTDTAGNIQEVSEIVYVLDLDAPQTPVINASSGYPILTEYGIKYDDVATISYDTRSDITNYYSIDNGTTWKVYTGPFQIASGIIMAKSVKNNTGLTISSKKTVSIPSDALGAAAYDDNTSTAFIASGNYYLNIDKSMIGEKININFGVSFSSNIRISYLNQNNTVLSTNYYNTRDGKWDIIQTIPKDTVRILFTMNLFNNEGTNYYPSVYEIKIADEPIITKSFVYPKISSNGIEKGFNNITIAYSKTSLKKLYKINDGDWKNYINEPIKLKLGDTIYTKGINYKGKETRIISNYTSLILDDALGIEAYDGNTNTAFTSSGEHYINVDKSMIGEKININFGVSFLSNISISYLNQNNTVLSTNYYNTRDGKWDIIQTIPKDTVRILFTMNLFNNEGTNYYPSVYEVSIKEENTNHSTQNEGESETHEFNDNSTQLFTFEDEPEFTVSSSKEWSTSKNVTIIYPSSDYQNEYSLDAENWLPYTDTIDVNDNTTVYARSMKDNEVISSSSYQITLIDNTKPTISLENVPETITLGDDYALPTSYTYDETKSKGDVSCSSNNMKITSTKDLVLGNHTIECVVTTGSGNKTTVTKEINVLQNQTVSQSDTNTPTTNEASSGSSDLTQNQEESKSTEQSTIEGDVNNEETTSE